MRVQSLLVPDSPLQPPLPAARGGSSTDAGAHPPAGAPPSQDPATPRARVSRGACCPPMDADGDILVLILERIDSQVSLIRAAAVCKRWRRAIADAAFFRRFRSLHAPDVAGDYHNHSPLPPFLMGAAARTSDGPSFVPSSPSIDARRFSLDFLPSGAGSWTIRDSRGSLLLVVRAYGFPQTLVCEPLTRRYKIIPPPACSDDGPPFIASYLVDGHSNEAGGRIGMSNFRVLCMLHGHGVTYTAVFTTAGDSGLWSERTIDNMAPRPDFARPLGHGGGSWYFYTQSRTLIVLDGSTGRFSSSSSVLPATEDWDSHTWNYNFFVTNGRDGKPRIFTVFDDTMKVFARLDGGEWVQEKGVLLPEATRNLPGYRPSMFSFPQNVLRRGVGFVVLSPQFGAPWPFSVDLETMEVAPSTAGIGPIIHRCELPWPPALHACVDG